MPVGGMVAEKGTGVQCLLRGFVELATKLAGTGAPVIQPRAGKNTGQPNETVLGSAAASLAVRYCDFAS